MNKTSRHQQRIWALQILYSLDIKHYLKPEGARIDIRELKKAENLDEDTEFYFESLVKGVIKNIGELDRKIDERAIDWDIKRLAYIDRNILRIAFFELDNDIPVGVAINEAVEIAKEYADTKSARFINGVLAEKEMDE